MARVSNPVNELNTETAPRLLKYLLRQKHWSPFEMVHATCYIECPRDISRQILRHRSFSFQEFSGRYAEYGDFVSGREPRLQDDTNRQNSIPLESDSPITKEWAKLVGNVQAVSVEAYRAAIGLGIAQEVARVLLPEGLTPTRMYMTGSLRSWIHYIQVRTDPSTQKEHREIAEMCKSAVFGAFPSIKSVLDI